MVKDGAEKTIPTTDLANYDNDQTVKIQLRIFQFFHQFPLRPLSPLRLLLLVDFIFEVDQKVVGDDSGTENSSDNVTESSL